MKKLLIIMLILFIPALTYSAADMKTEIKELKERVNKLEKMALIQLVTIQTLLETNQSQSAYSNYQNNLSIPIKRDKWWALHEQHNKRINAYGKLISELTALAEDNKKTTEDLSKKIDEFTKYNEPIEWDEEDTDPETGLEE